MKKIISSLLILLLTVMGSACGGNKAEPFTANVSVNTEGHTIHHAEIKIKGYGTVTLALDETVAPITVKNFIDLAKSGYYDGLTFIRVQQNFVIQGGEGKTSTPAIKGEFASNGVENNLSHKKGIISMARTNEKDSASSQFFIMLADNAGLDGDYAAFGWVTKGMNIIEEVCADIPNNAYLNYMGFLDERYQPVIEKITITD